MLTAAHRRSEAVLESRLAEAEKDCLYQMNESLTWKGRYNTLQAERNALRRERDELLTAVNQAFAGTRWSLTEQEEHEDC